MSNEQSDLQEPHAEGGGEGPAHVTDAFTTANDRFKESFGSWLWGSILAATALHFAVVAFFPQLGVDDYGMDMDEVEVVEMPPEIELPPPPEDIQRPAEPVITDAEIDQDVTIEETDFEAHQPDDLPPPPDDDDVDLSDQPTFTPHTQAPRVENQQEVQQALQDNYPSHLQSAGIGGEVIMHFFITEDGTVDNFLIDVESDHQQLNDAALNVAEVFEFSPAYNREERVPVWVQLPIRFEAN